MFESFSIHIPRVFKQRQLHFRVTDSIHSPRHPGAAVGRAARQSGDGTRAYNPARSTARSCRVSDSAPSHSATRRPIRIYDDSSDCQKELAITSLFVAENSV